MKGNSQSNLKGGINTAQTNNKTTAKKEDREHPFTPPKQVITWFPG